MMEKTKRLNFNVDLLQGNIFHSMVLFAIPIMISTAFQQLYNTVDTMIVGQVLGDTALAAMGAGMPIYDLLVGSALGISSGLSVVVARNYGLGNEKHLKNSVACAIVIGFGVAVLITILAQAGSYPLMQQLNTPREIIGQANRYISVITLFTAVTFAYNLCSGLLRATGNSMMPLVFLMISSVVNIGLDLLFIWKLGLGIEGAAIATVISQGISVVLCLVYISRRAKILVPKKEHFKLHKALFREMLGQGFSMGFMHCIVSAGSVVLQSGINGLGYLTIAGHTAARKIFQFCIMPVTAMANSVATFVSQNRGADQGSRIRKGIRYAMFYNSSVALVLTLISAFFAPFFIALISGSEEPVVLTNGALYLRVAAPFYAVLGTLFDLRFALQGLGNKMLPLLSSIIELIGKIIFAAFLIPRIQYAAVVFCEPVIWCFMLLQLLFSFYRNPYIRNAK